MPDLSNQEVKDAQRALNAFTEKRLRGVAPLIVDGDKGPATDKRIRECKYFLGYKRPTGAAYGKNLARRLRRPKNPDVFPDPKYVVRGIARRAAQRLRYRQQLIYSYVAPGVVRFEGVPVAKVAIPLLEFARKHGWTGRLNSGWRSPSYSQSLCQRMCGAPSCPGLCAGTSSNHVGTTADRFALDVSDYVKFGQLMARPDCPRPHVKNDLPRDLVHYSPNGH